MAKNASEFRCSKAQRREAQRPQRPALGVCQETGSLWQPVAAWQRFRGALSQEPMNCDTQLKQCIAECRRVLEAEGRSGFRGSRPRKASLHAKAKAAQCRSAGKKLGDPAQFAL